MREVDEHVEHGLQNDPENADGGLFVADFDVAPYEEIKQLAVGPDFAKAQLEEAAGRPDADDRGGARARRKVSGLWRCRERSHALRPRSPKKNCECARGKRQPK